MTLYGIMVVNALTVVQRNGKMVKEQMFKEQDTSWLQLESVIKFAKSLGYEFDGRSFYDNELYPSEKFIKGKRIYTRKKSFLSFAKMQNNHNVTKYRMKKGPFEYSWNNIYPEFDERCDLSSKIVEKSTLQWHKKKKQFIAQNNMVKFV